MRLQAAEIWENLKLYTEWPPAEGLEKEPRTDSCHRDYISQLALLMEVLEKPAGEKVTWVTVLPQ